jgi:ethanolamine utilization protein EutP (predicted NTPase)
LFLLVANQKTLIFLDKAKQGNQSSNKKGQAVSFSDKNDSTSFNENQGRPYFGLVFFLLSCWKTENT